VYIYIDASSDTYGGTINIHHMLHDNQPWVFEDDIDAAGKLNFQKLSPKQGLLFFSSLLFSTHHFVSTCVFYNTGRTRRG
jgi:hypothetical protein